MKVWHLGNKNDDSQTRWLNAWLPGLLVKAEVIILQILFVSSQQKNCISQKSNHADLGEAFVMKWVNTKSEVCPFPPS